MFLFGQYPLEKVGEAKRLVFELVLTVGASVAPVLASVNPAPLGPSMVDIVTNNTTGTLCPAITFTGLTATASWTGGSVLNPLLGVEIADGMVTASGIFIGAWGIITATSGAGNISLGQNVFSPAASAQFSAGVGLTFNLQFGIAPASQVTNLLNSINAASGTVKALVEAMYLDR